MVMTNVLAIFSDKEHWKHPDAFNPENFLDENGNFFKPECFIPFLLGESAVCEINKQIEACISKSY